MIHINVAHAYLLFLQWLNNLLHTHLQVFDVVLLCLQQLLNDL